MDHRAFDALVGDFYRAATGAMSWPAALQTVQQAFDARFVLLHTLDMADGRLLRLESSRDDASDCEFEYLREYHRIDPRRLRTLELGAAGFGQWLHDHEHFDAEFIAGDRFYQDFVPAYDTRHHAHVVFPLEGSVAIGFVLELAAGRGPLAADEREVARRLGEHMREALLAHQRVRSLMAQALAGHTLLNGFAYPMWLLEADRLITFENPAACDESQRGTRVAHRGDRLALVRSAADRELSERLHGLTGAGHGASSVIDLRATRADAPTWLHLSVLVPGAALGAFGNRPQVLATLFDPANVSPLDAFALSNLFDLTPTEAKVAARLADGLTAEEIGERHGTTESTVRSQIRQVIHKVGAERAVDVVRILRQGEVLWAAAGTRSSA